VWVFRGHLKTGRRRGESTFRRAASRRGAFFTIGFVNRDCFYNLRCLPQQRNYVPYEDTRNLHKCKVYPQSPQVQRQSAPAILNKYKEHLRNLHKYKDKVYPQCFTSLSSSPQQKNHPSPQVHLEITATAIPGRARRWRTRRPPKTRLTTRTNHKAGPP
jgi:hypothetical protein